MEVVEVVNGEEVRLVENILLDPLGVLVEAEALLPVHDGARHEHPLPRRGGEGIKHDDPLGGILGRELLGGKPDAVVGAGERGGKHDAEQVAARVEQRGQGAHGVLDVDLRGDRHFARPHHVVESGAGKRRIVAGPGDAADRVGQFQLHDMVLGRKPRNHIRAGVGNDDIRIHVSPLPTGIANFSPLYHKSRSCTIRNHPPGAIFLRYPGTPAYFPCRCISVTRMPSAILRKMGAAASSPDLPSSASTTTAYFGVSAGK